MRSRIVVGLVALAMVLFMAPAAQAVVPPDLSARALEQLICSTGLVDSETGACTFKVAVDATNDLTITVSQLGDQLTVKFDATGIYRIKTAAVGLYNAAPDTSDLTANRVAFDDETYPDASLPTSASFTFDLVPENGALFGPGECPFFLANADLVGTPEVPDFEQLESLLPDNVYLDYSSGSTTYLEVALSNGKNDDGTSNTLFDGKTFDAWCVDADRYAKDSTAKVYSSLNPPMPGAIDWAANLDIVNWVVNNYEAGVTDLTGCSNPKVSSADIQAAIWKLVNDSSDDTLGTPAMTCGAWAIYNRADELFDLEPYDQEQGAFEYEPPCGGLIAVILVPVDSSGNVTGQVLIGQVLAINLPTQCNPTQKQVSACFTCCLDGEIIVEKSTDPDASPVSFEFVPSWGDAFYLKDGESKASGFLAPGTYSVSEKADASWVNEVECTSDDPNREGEIDPSAIVLADSEVITCTFTNTQRGSLEVTKTVDILAGTPTTNSFTICIMGPSYESGDCRSFTAGQTEIWDNLISGAYTVSENAIGEDGWTVLVTGSPATVPAGGTAYASVTNTFDREEEFGCTYTQGYWKTHAESKKKQYDETWDNIGPNTIFFLSNQTYLQVMQMPSADGNVYYILAQQYIAAKLNSFIASTPDEVDDAIAAAEAFFEAYTPATALELTLETRQTYINFAMTLDNYNNGLIGPGHCD